MNYSYYRPGDTKGNEEDYPPGNGDLFTLLKEVGEFHIGQGYDGCPATMISCIECEGTSFHVACGNHYTAIRCLNCKWEECIHEG